MHRLIFLLGIIALPIWVKAQTAVPAWKISLANEVLRRVGAAYGFDILELPKLVIYPKRPSNRNIAHLELASVSVKTLDRSRLLMDEELFDTCLNTDGSGAALAFVFSHEMAHFYLKHSTFRSFAEQKGVGMSERISSQQEQDADQKGLLFAYLAGYDPERVLDHLFDVLYAQYQLTNELKGYPSKSERQQKTRFDVQSFRTYAYLFAVGYALYCRENFDEAARCFEYVYTRYPLKEAYLNYGVCRLQSVVRLMKKTNLSYFALPFEADPRNRLLRMGERSESVEATTVKVLLAEAEAAFRRAIDMDFAYGPAYLNQALTGIFAGNPLMALGIMEELRQNGTLPPNGHLVRGVAYWAYGDLAKAESDFKKAVAQRAYQAEYNSLIFKAAKRGNVQDLRQPWQRLTVQKPDMAVPGCQTGAQMLKEIDTVPANLPFTSTLIEQSVPAPFLFIKSAKLGTDTYFWVKMARSTIYFILKDGVGKAAR